MCEKNYDDDDDEVVRKWMYRFVLFCFVLFCFVLFCFTCKHRNLIRNALKLRFNNMMASVQVRLIECLANKQRKQQIWWT